MANNYRQASFVIPNLTAVEEEWLRADLAARDADTDDPINFAWSFHDDENRYLWLRDAGEWIDTDQVSALCCAFLKKHRPCDTLGFTYADTCSKPRVGEFSGGAVLCSARGARVLDAGDWLARGAWAGRQGRPAGRSAARQARGVRRTARGARRPRRPEEVIRWAVRREAG